MNDSSSGGIKYSHLYHAIGKLRPQPEKEDALGKYDAGCALLLFQMALGALADGSCIHLKTSHLAEACFCGQREIKYRLRTLLNYGYIKKVVDADGKTVKYGRTVLYDLCLPGVHDVQIMSITLEEPERSIQPTVEQTQEQETQETEQTEEQEQEDQRQRAAVIEMIVKNIREGQNPKRMMRLCRSWNISIESCIEAAKEEEVPV